jgi:hypothetical protein
MNIENKQLEEYINYLNSYSNKEIITLKNDPEYSLQKYGKSI